MHRPSRSRAGFALVDAIIGGVILAFALVTLLSLSGRSMKNAQQGEDALVAAGLLDELLNLVLADGPADFPKLYDTFGHYEAPFDGFDYEVIIDHQGEGFPYRVTAIVRSDAGFEYRVETLINQREGDEPNPVRAPLEILDREARYDEQEEQL
jgi:hypothetical protein